jgi:hypothetical protein
MIVIAGEAQAHCVGTYTKQGVRDLNSLPGTPRRRPSCPPCTPGRPSYRLVKGEFGFMDSIVTVRCILCGEVVNRYREPHVW